MAAFDVNYKEVESFADLFEKYGDDAYKTVNEVIHSNEAVDIIKGNIQKLIPTGHEWWKGSHPHANQAPLGRLLDHETKEMLSTSISTTGRGKFYYLVFPDSYTGDQDFMGRGAENSTEEIINLCLGKLTDGFE